MTPEERAAFHWSGEAICYFLYGWKINHIKLTDGIDVSQPQDFDLLDLIHARVVSLCAGPAAEQQHAQEPKVIATAAFEKDAQALFAAIYQISRDQSTWVDIAEKSKDAARSIIKKHWAILQTLAEALLEHKELSGEIVTQILSAGVRREVSGETAVLKQRKGKDIILQRGVDYEYL